MKRHGRDVVFPRGHRVLVERLNVFQDVREMQLAGVNPVGGEEVQRLVNRIANTSPIVIEKVKAAIAGRSKRP